MNLTFSCVYNSHTNFKYVYICKIFKDYELTEYTITSNNCESI